MTTARYARLTAPWLLRGWRDVPGALVNWRTGAVQELGKDALHVARACDGQVNFASMAFLPAHREVLDAFVARGIAVESPSTLSLDPRQGYRKASNSRLLGIQWAVTRRCNLRCRHCYLGSPSSRDAELTFDDLSRLVDQFEAANVVTVSLTGGEPFARRDILDLIALLASRRIRIRDVYSNATLITDRHLEAIAALANDPILRISFDGCGTHDAMRGVPGTEARVVETIRRIRRAGLRVTVTTCVDRTTVHCLPATYELMKRLDVHAWGVGRPQPAGEWKRASTQMSMEALAAACTPLVQRWVADGRPFTLGLEGFLSERGVRRDVWVDERRATPGRRAIEPSEYACDTCRLWSYLAPDGTLLPCVGYEDANLHARLPNLFRVPLAAAWDHASIRAFLDITKKDVVAKNPACGTCEFLAECGGGCRACARAATGDALGKDPVHCEVFRGRYRVQFAAMARETGT